MSDVARLGLRRAPWRWAVVLVAGIGLLVGGIVAARGGHSGGSPGSLAGSNNSGGANGASDGGARNGNGNGHGASGAAALSSPGSQSSASPGSAHASPHASGTPYAYQTPGDWIEAIADMKTSTCPNGYPTGATCKVYVHGKFYLAEPSAQLVVEVVIDTKVVYSQTYKAPGGGHQFGSLMQFQVPQGAHEIDYDAILEDSSGKVLTKYMFPTFATRP